MYRSNTLLKKGSLCYWQVALFVVIVWLSSAVVTHAAPIAVDNSNLIWSPYGWIQNGSAYKQSPTVGSHVRAAFTGDTLGINFDPTLITGNGGSLSNISVGVSIDGGAPTYRPLSDAPSGQLIFSSTLDTGLHYAVITIAKNGDLTGRWTPTAGQPRSTLRITSLEISDSGSVQSLAGSPLEKRSPRILYYGDSIIEGNGIGGTYGDVSVGARVGNLLNAEFGIKGYASSMWYFNILSGVPDFHEAPGPSYVNSVWRNYYGGTSILNDSSDPASGYIEGAPDAVYNSLGINDSMLYPNVTWGGEPARAAFKQKIKGWLPEVRAALTGRPAVFMVVPFNYSCTVAINPSTDESLMQLYKQTYLEAVNEYLADSGDTRTFIIDLGEEACQVVVDSGDSLHPNPTGANILASMITARTESLLVFEDDVRITAEANGQAIVDDMKLVNPPVFTGTAPAGTVVTLELVLGGTTQSCVATADASGEWECAFDEAFAFGEYTLRISGQTSWGESIPMSDTVVVFASEAEVPNTAGGQVEDSKDGNTLARSGSNTLFIALGGVLIVVISGILFTRVRP